MHALTASVVGCPGHQFADLYVRRGTGHQRHRIVRANGATIYGHTRCSSPRRRGHFGYPRNGFSGFATVAWKDPALGFPRRFSSVISPARPRLLHLCHASRSRAGKPLGRVPARAEAVGVRPRERQFMGGGGRVPGSCIRRGPLFQSVPPGGQTPPALSRELGWTRTDAASLSWRPSCSGPPGARRTARAARSLRPETRRPPVKPETDFNYSNGQGGLFAWPVRAPRWGSFGQNPAADQPMTSRAGRCPPALLPLGGHAPYGRTAGDRGRQGRVRTAL